MKKISQYQWLVDIVTKELHEIKGHLCNDRQFEGGVALGYLIRLVSDQVEENEQVQEEEIDEEYEESSEEEDSSEDSYYEYYLREEKLKREAGEKIEELVKKNNKLEKETESIKATKRAIFDLQDLIMRLLKFKKIEEIEIPHVLNILRNTGVEECDIKVLCHLKKEEV